MKQYRNAWSSFVEVFIQFAIPYLGGHCCAIMFGVIVALKNIVFVILHTFLAIWLVFANMLNMLTHCDFEFNRLFDNGGGIVGGTHTSRHIVLTVNSHQSALIHVMHTRIGNTAQTFETGCWF